MTDRSHDPTAAPVLRRVFIANRGEIALRIVRACRALGLQAVVGVSEADQQSLPARLADAQVLLGPAPAAQSYLDAARLVEAAQASGCDAVHPGYGFLSEQAGFARACREAGLVFVGPSPEVIEAMGDKIVAARHARQAGLPCLPASGAVHDADQAGAEAARIGYPVLLKAAAGGGGRGMRLVREAGAMAAAWASASAEAGAAFGDATLYVEKLIERARHIEIQLLGDRHGRLLHLGERDCSVQRRHQKLLEEAPAPRLPEATRQALAEAALALGRQVGYESAGTVEFVLDEDSGLFYFLEMNTRIQVEHPVTEMLTGIDLVAEQLRVAAGQPLRWRQDELRWHGHAIECRINAEDPARQFLPRPGLVRRWQAPEGEGLRCDSHCHDGHVVSPHYDSLLAKLIVHADSREAAIERMRAALAALQVEGPPTTAGFQRELLQHPDFVNARVSTRWVENTVLARA